MKHQHQQIDIKTQVSVVCYQHIKKHLTKPFSCSTEYSR